MWTILVLVSKIRVTESGEWVSRRGRMAMSGGGGLKSLTLLVASNKIGLYHWVWDIFRGASGWSIDLYAAKKQIGRPLHLNCKWVWVDHDHTKVSFVFWQIATAACLWHQIYAIYCFGSIKFLDWSTASWHGTWVPQVTLWDQSKTFNWSEE